MSDHRGERQQPGFLVKAMEKLKEAAELHDGGFRDPALARADEAAAYLEDYRKGPVMVNEDVLEDDDG